MCPVIRCIVKNVLKLSLQVKSAKGFVTTLNAFKYLKLLTSKTKRGEHGIKD